MPTPPPSTILRPMAAGQPGNHHQRPDHHYEMRPFAGQSNGHDGSEHRRRAHDSRRPGRSDAANGQVAEISSTQEVQRTQKQTPRQHHQRHGPEVRKGETCGHDNRQQKAEKQGEEDDGERRRPLHSQPGENSGAAEPETRHHGKSDGGHWGTRRNRRTTDRRTTEGGPGFAIGRLNRQITVDNRLENQVAVGAPQKRLATAFRVGHHAQHVARFVDDSGDVIGGAVGVGRGGGFPDGSQ